MKRVVRFNNDRQMEPADDVDAPGQFDLNPGDVLHHVDGVTIGEVLSVGPCGLVQVLPWEMTIGCRMAQSPDYRKQPVWGNA